MIQSEVFKQTKYSYIVAERANVKVLCNDNDDKPLKTFFTIKKYCDLNDIDDFSVMNGGIFEADYTPTGLLIQNSRVLFPLNVENGRGNFFLKPNGVFYITDNAAKICNALHIGEEKKRIKYATQSGPLLVSDGTIHKAFNKFSKSRLLRNGVGILENGKIILAISNKDSISQPNLFEFALFFQSKGCKNALYLDGVISELKTRETIVEEGRSFSSFILINTPD